MLCINLSDLFYSSTKMFKKNAFYLNLVSQTKGVTPEEIIKIILNETPNDREHISVTTPECTKANCYQWSFPSSTLFWQICQLCVKYSN